MTRTKTTPTWISWEYCLHRINLLLTVLRYDRIIKYLQKHQKLQMKLEVDPKTALQKKILNRSNKPTVLENHCDLLYPSLEAAKKDASLEQFLEDYYKFRRT
uniref:Uncharacterized protein n=1 Tax=Glossina austeni TaxID=7395 RepID=A0A1A9UVP6_GLOAU